MNNLPVAPDLRGSHPIRPDANGSAAVNFANTAAAAAAANAAATAHLTFENYDDDWHYDYSYDYDGAFDLFKIYESGRVSRKERDTNNDGRTDFWEYLDAEGNVVKVGRDVDGDGVMDVRED